MNRSHLRVASHLGKQFIVFVTWQLFTVKGCFDLLKQVYWILGGIQTLESAATCSATFATVIWYWTGIFIKGNLTCYKSRTIFGYLVSLGY